MLSTSMLFFFGVLLFCLLVSVFRFPFSASGSLAAEGMWSLVGGGEDLHESESGRFCHGRCS